MKRPLRGPPFDFGCRSRAPRSVLEHSTNPREACRRGDLFGAKLGNAKDTEEIEETELCLLLDEEEEASEERGGVVDREDITFSS
jgi:hypothetical protein